MIETINVLVVDDDDVTSELVERSLRKCDVPYRIIAAADGHEGLDLLLGRTGVALTRPLIVLLDLNMPRMNGFEFLDAVRSNPEIDDTVIFVLTTSAADNDRSRAYHGQISGFMTKSALGPQFTRLAQLLCGFAKVVHLP
jgi:CheY-like chemotaxis protein